ncbi:ribonuclease H-like domain-containing protein [Xylariomycetidae sp. FL2044]|nr:ribonuclease H-like domain-containing protein [Xylariomycetidae sp. FL2044]
MAPELSSNWKKLQAKIKVESTAAPTDSKPPPAKRKNSDTVATHSKRQRTGVKGTEKKHHSSKASTSTTKSPPPSSISMGVPQSSTMVKGTTATITPSLALWAEDNDISTEALAEAYSLGTKNNALLHADRKDRVNEGLAPGIEVGKYIAIDCEMVGVGPSGYDSVLARASVVDFHGNQVYDSYVRPKETVTDWRTAITGITPKHMATARSFDEVQAEIASLIEGRIVVGHDIRHDLAVLMLKHPSPAVRDTARFSGFRRFGHGPKPALRVLARELLGVEIQGGVHSSLEDARVAMLLFRKRKPEFDVECAGKFGLSSMGGREGKDKDGGKEKAKGSRNGKKKKKKKH